STRDFAKDLDVQLLAVVIGITALGAIMVGTTSVSLAAREFDEPLFFFVRHLAALGIGCIGLVLAMLIPMSVWFRMNGLLLVSGFALLVLVLVPGFGASANGSTRWLVLGPLQLQASEPARLFLLMYLASYAVRHSAALASTFSSFLKPLLIVGIVGLLLIAEPDFGTLVVMTTTSLGILFVAGSRLRDFFAAVVCAGGILGALVVTSSYRWQRVLSYLDPFADPFDSGFQLVNSLIAIGRGDWFGAGLGESVQKLFYLPEAHTDFVFAVLAEELGFVGSTLTLVLFAFLVFRTIQIGQHALDAGLPFQGFVAIGIGLMVGIEAFINIGVNIGLLPTKGLALPLISYGRSSAIITLIAVGLVLRIAMETRAAQRNPRRRRT
ncbi:MAG: putative lipid II flippase FtsW, partial [Gammaproteobacteria bacterium]